MQHYSTFISLKRDNVDLTGVQILKHLYAEDDERVENAVKYVVQFRKFKMAGKNLSNDLT